MHIIIKGLHGLAIPEDITIYTHNKIEELLCDLVDPTICEVVFDDTHSRDAENKNIHITVTSSHIKNPIHIELSAKNYYTAIDTAAAKLSRALHHAKH